MAGQYNIVITKSDGSQHETGWFDNLITNNGLDCIGRGESGMIDRCHIGTGTAAPDFTQTSLVSWVASARHIEDGTGNSGAPNYVNWIGRKFQFTVGSVVGNMTEIGVSNRDDNTNLFSRALISSESGGVYSPQAITLTASDQLTVYYRLYTSPPLTDVTGTFDINGVTYTYTSRACDVGGVPHMLGGGGHVFGGYCRVYGSDYALVPITSGFPNYSVFYYPDGAKKPYVNGTYNTEITLVIPNTWDDVTNIGGFGWYMGYYSANTVITPPIPKNNTNTLTLTVTMSWDRA